MRVGDETFTSFTRRWKALIAEPNQMRSKFPFWFKFSSILKSSYPSPNSLSKCLSPISFTYPKWPQIYNAQKSLFPITSTFWIQFFHHLNVEYLHSLRSKTIFLYKYKNLMSIIYVFYGKLQHGIPWGRPSLSNWWL